MTDSNAISVSITGPQGSGKSSLANILAKFLHEHGHSPSVLVEYSDQLNKSLRPGEVRLTIEGFKPHPPQGSLG